jgi:CTP synthase (UTP-ammonia lyase)
MIPSLAILGEYTSEFEPHAATNAAIRHSCGALGLGFESVWVATTEVDDSLFRRHRAIWVAPGSPYRDMGRVLEAIRYAREQRIPCLGTCGGFQHIVIEYARNVLGFQDAQHAEYDPYASDLFVSRLACSLVGREMKLHFAAGSLVARCYGGESATERYYCNFGVHPDRAAILTSRDLRVVASDAEGEVRAVELPGHPFFVGTLYVPQMRSAVGTPHPLVNAFLLAASGRSEAAAAAQYR